MADRDDDAVQLTDLEVIQQFSLAVRGATASRSEVIAALESDLAYLTSGPRKAAPKPVQPAPAAKQAAPAPAQTKAPAKAAVKKAPAKKASPSKSTRRG